ncbi:DUF257 domain-containing protein [Thermococcus aggregans]|uniref:DUF257 domain-containing protein n=1 Tax=Thermococcus aggregans TaxID=110163 RepID=A0A9E7MXH7_THEAG|nr:DUF257 domain-containing protein [Thermococcus aggregans]
MLERTIPEAVSLLEELATTVVRVKVCEKTYAFSVVKAVNRELLGLKVAVP